MWALQLLLLACALIVSRRVDAFRWTRALTTSRSIFTLSRDSAQGAPLPCSALCSASEGRGEDLDARVALLEQERLESFLEKKTRAWEGNWDILKRKSQVPSEEYGATDVVDVIMTSLRESDSPQLDHGPAVILSFACENGALADSNMDPSGLGSFLRSRYSTLLDWRRYEIEETQEVTNENDLFERCTVRVKVSGWGFLLGSLGSGEEDDEDLYEFSMVQEKKNWLVDVIVKRS